MKKIKLITPILGVTTLATSLVPLTSCNKNNGMSQEQWNKAFAAIKDPWDTSRNFTVEGYTYTLDDEGKETKLQTWAAKASGKFNEGTITQSDTDTYDSCIIDNIIWVRDKKGGFSPCIDDTGLAQTMIQAFVGFGEIFDLMYKHVTYKGNNKYQAPWLELGYIHGISDFEFDKDLKVTSIDTRVHYGKNITNDNMLYAAKLNFSKYGSTTTELKESDFDDAKNQIINATLSGSKYTVSVPTALATKSCLYNFNNIAIDGLNTITLTSNSYYQTPYLMLNGEQLIEDIDYTRGDKKITLTNPLKKNDKLVMNAKLHNEAESTIELSAA